MWENSENVRQILLNAELTSSPFEREAEIRQRDAALRSLNQMIYGFFFLLESSRWSVFSQLTDGSSIRASVPVQTVKLIVGSEETEGFPTQPVPKLPDHRSPEVT